MKVCWTCRRRRLICDGASPRCRKCELRGVECLGYTKPLTWVAGASRGHMAGRSLNKATSQGDGDRNGNLSSKSSYWWHSTERSSSLDPTGYPFSISSTQSISRCLTEPLFQDLSFDSRFFINYFERLMCRFLVLNDSTRNPYRALIPLIGSSKGVLNAIMSIAVCHLIHSTTGVPVFSSPYLKGLESRSSNGTTAQIGFSDQSLMGYLLTFKQNSVRYMSEALLRPNEHIGSSTLATAVLLVALDIWEGGSGPWNFHLEGAKGLIEVGVMNGSFDPDGHLGSLVHGLAMLETFGSTLLRPGVLTRPLRTHLGSAPYHETPDITIVGCPHDIASAIDIVTTQRQNYISTTSSSQSNTSAQPVPYALLEQTLRLIKVFDVQSWAQKTIASSPHSSLFPAHILIQMGTVWQLSATLYTTRILQHITGQHNSLGNIVDAMMAQYVLLDDNEDALKCLLWPVFIAGAESITLDHKSWALGMMDRMWNITLSANSRKAATVLKQYWASKEQNRASHPRHEGSEQDWFGEFEVLSDRLLIF